MLMIVVFFNGESPSDLIKIANQDLKQIIKWLNINKLSLNIKKSKYILFSPKNITPVYNERLYINNVEIDRTKQIKFLGYIIDEKLSWKSHINYILLKVRIFMKSGRHDHTLPLFKKLNILPFNSLYVYIYNMLVNIFKIRNELLPEIFIVNFKININITTRNIGNRTYILFQNLEHNPWKIH